MLQKMSWISIPFSYSPSLPPSLSSPFLLPPLCLFNSYDLDLLVLMFSFFLAAKKKEGLEEPKREKIAPMITQIIVNAWAKGSKNEGD